MHVGVDARATQTLRRRERAATRVQRRLDRVRDRGLEEPERRDVDRRVVIPHARGVVAERDPRALRLGVAEVLEPLLDVERAGQAVLDVEVVLGVGVMRRRARPQQRRRDVAVQVEQPHRLRLRGQVADDPGLRLHGVHLVAVEVVAGPVLARAGDAAVRVRRDVEHQAVALQQRLDGRVGALGVLVDHAQDGVGALPLVAVDVAVDEDRRLVAGEQRRVGARGDRLLHDLALPRRLLRLLRVRLGGRDGHDVDVAPARRPARYSRRDAVAGGLKSVQLGRDLVVRRDTDRDRRVIRVIRPDGEGVLLRIGG